MYNGSQPASVDEKGYLLVNVSEAEYNKWLEELLLNEKYALETGRQAWRAGRRLLRAKAVLEGTNTTLHQWKFVTNKDRYWPTRKNRTLAERQAVLLGNTSQSGRYRDEHYVWFVPSGGAK